MQSFGKNFKITLYGESHQDNIGVIIDGLPPGLNINEDTIKEDLVKRNPVAVGTTPRKEPDHFIITSGLFNQKTTGSALHITIKNENIKSKDYSHLAHHFRPNHADFVASHKYHNHQDYRGGGRFSGRLTAPIVIAGNIAKSLTPSFKYETTIKQIGSLTNLTNLDSYLQSIKDEGDSVGGIIEIKVTNLPIGLGEPMFLKLESHLSQILFAMPAVKGMSFGTGFEGAHLKGSTFNDVFINEKGHTKTNHSGGVTGGMSNGNPLIIKVFIKPTSSIQKPQETFNFKTKQIETLEIGGRHDVAIIRRAPIVLEHAAAIALTDLYLEHLKNEALYASLKKTV